MVQVLIVDDNPIFREKIIKLLKTKEDIQVIGQAKNGLEAVRMANNLKPNVVVMDIDTPILDGVEATTLIKKDNPQIDVIILSFYNNHEDPAKCLEAGASVCLDKEESILALEKMMLGNHA